MARISQYDQDSTLNKLDKVVGTDSATGATKNYTIDSMIGLVNSEDLVNVFDGVSYSFKSYEAGSTNPRGIINLNAGAAASSPFSGISQIYVSVLDKHGNSIANYLDDTLNSFIRIVQKTDINTYGVLEVTAVANHDSGAYKKLTVTPRANNGNIVVNEEYFISNYSAVFDQDFSDDSVTEFGDVTSAGSGQIITNAERTSLNNFTANGLLHADVVNNVTSTATDVPLSAAQGKVLKDLINTINTLLTSDNTDLDSLQEVVDFIEANKDTLDNLSISNIAGLQAALDAKQNTETGKGLSTNDFTTALLNKLNGIAAGAQVNVKPSWTAGAGTDAEILNKPTDLTDLSAHNVTELSDITSAGSGSIISSAERTKLNGIAAGAEVNVQANWNEGNASSDAFIQNKPDLTLKADKATTIQVAGTTNEIEVSPTGAQDLSANRTFTVGLPNDVTIGGDLKVNETFELVNAQSSTPTFDNGIYYSTEDGHDTLHFRYHDHDLSIDYLTENIPTGILNGGVLSTNTNTTFDIAAGDGIVNILNKSNSDPHPEIKKVSWGATTVTHTLGDAGNANQLNTWVYINNAGTVVQTLTTPTPSVWRNNIVLGSVIHSSNVIRFVKTFPRPAYSNGNTVSEFIEVFGPLKKSGHLLTVNSSNTMRLDRGAGISFALGRNYQTNAEEPNISSDGASTPVFHRYSSTATGFTKDNGTGGAGYTAIDPTKYDNNGTLTTVSSGQYTVQRLYHFPNNTSVIVAYYGKAQYASIDEAEKNYLLENFQEADNTAQQAIYLGALIVKGNATNLGNSAQAKILTGGIFRSLSATNLGGVAADAAINDLTDVNIVGVANDEILQYNSSTGNWENQAGISGSGAANKLAIWSSGSALSQDTNLHWDTSNDRLGIGTASPSHILTLESAGSPALKIKDTTQGTTLLAFSQDANSHIGTFSNHPLVFDTNSAERMRITSSGNVGIGTSSSLIQKFTVAGNIDIAGGNGSLLTFNNGDAKIVINNNGSSRDLSFQTYDGSSTAERMRITGSGDVGIGTTSPDATLDIQGDGADFFLQSADFKIARIQPRGTGANLDKGLFSLFDGSTENVRIDTEGNSWLNGGNVSIGHTSPTALLDVRRSDASGRVAEFHNNVGYGINIDVESDGGVNTIGSATNQALAFVTNGGSNERMRIDIAGNVGIGTASPSVGVPLTAYYNSTSQFHFGGAQGGISNNVYLDSSVTAYKNRNTGAGGALLQLSTDGSFSFRRATSGSSPTLTYSMYIDGSGNVGIGTTSPSEKLTVAGNGNFTGKLAVGSSAAHSTYDFYNQNTAYFNGAVTVDDTFTQTGGGASAFSGNISTSGVVLFNDNQGINFGNSNAKIYGSSADGIKFNGSGSEKMRLTQAGNVGIGTTSPSEKLEVIGNVRADVSNGGGFMLTGASASGLVRNNATGVALRTNTTDRLIIDSSGNVGIGTSNPSVSLDINDTDAVKMPAGTTTERNAITSPANGMFRYNTTDNQFEGYANGAWGAIAGSGGSGSSTVTIEKNVYTGDGSDLTFNTTTAIVNENNVQVYIDGVYQSKDTYTTSSSTVTFGSGNAPANGASVELIHMVSVDAVIARDSFTGNGSTTAYVLSKGISNENATQVYLDGVYQSKNNYSTSGSTLTFSTAPPNGTAIEVVHIKASVDSSTQWQSSIKTADFTASAGEGYFVNTTSGTVTVSLPAGSVGDEIHFTDYASTFDTNQIIFDANGSQKIQGRTTNAKNATEGATVRLIYQDDIKGWTGNILDIPAAFALSYLVVAGGGGGGHVGGGGAGGYRTNYGGTALTLLPNTNYTVTVGGGGAASTSTGSPANAASGSASVFSTISSAGGGYGGANYTFTNGPAASGGSGGGGPWDGTQASHHLGGSGNTPSTSPSQGNNGGSGHTSHPNYSGGGGGGASAVGTNGTGSTGGTGGAGSANSITGSSVTYAGGGGGQGMIWGGDGTAGSGGAGGGGNGSKSNTGSVASGSAPSNGTANLGGGGGSPGYTTTGVGAGGSGVVIVRYPSDRSVVIPGGSGLVTSQLNATVSGSTDKYTTFTGGTGTIQFS